MKKIEWKPPKKLYWDKKALRYFAYIQYGDIKLHIGQITKWKKGEYTLDSPLHHGSEKTRKLPVSKSLSLAKKRMENDYYKLFNYIVNSK